MKSKVFGLAIVLAVCFTVPAFGVELTFHGDMDNRFMVYTNHMDFLKSEQQGRLHDGTVDENWGEIKYRFWTEAGSDDGNIRGVYAIEIGGIHFGKPGSLGKGTGGSYSGDSVNIETRWAYTDFQLPRTDRKARVRIGLMPFNANKFLWNETAMGATLNGAWDMFDYQLAWMRTYEFENESDDNDAQDVDNFLFRLNASPQSRLRAGIFALYQGGDPDEDNPGNWAAINPREYLLKKFADKADIAIWNIGVDGDYGLPMSGGKLFFNWDAIYQTGSIDSARFGITGYNEADKKFSDFEEITRGDFDLSAWFFHTDIGYEWDDMKVTYTFWYTSGDDDPNDHDFDGFLATDLDISDSIVIFEGSCTGDDVFSERHYLLDRGFIMNKIAFDYRATEKLKMGMAGMYMLTAEDVEYTDPRNRRHKNNDVGFEVDGYITYYLYKNLECTLSAGYLLSGDVMDYFEVDEIQDGTSDEDVFVSSARVRYRF
ncbi:hypothetical protein DENIS_4969 [Desulfonema ishimotonii]|uniref:Porin n=1 Tax=Desulfonema ishimotonii TaxID=45657 RepID=A0A401G405_9BACT|nr:hypothetical protein [Desulfonema ishimotonii]GBC63969.1 hypothetical protein DENIS_4969 [Desulfonema ishimotonii]